MVLIGYCPKWLTTIGVKTGSRLEVMECLDIAARGLVRTKLQLRKLEDLESVR